MRVLISGPPGAGKTTLVKRVCEKIECKGFYTEEVRKGGKRIGFDAVRIETRERVPIARVNYPGPRVGKYGVILENIDRVVEWLKSAKGFVAVDEIGPMELKHPKFGEVVLEVLRNAEGFIATVHRSLARKWSELLGVEVIWLTRENREEVYKEVLAWFR